MSATKALTIGEIGKRIGWPNHKIDYFIRSRNIKPIQRAGNLRVFSEDVVDRLRNESKANTHNDPVLERPQQ